GPLHQRRPPRGRRRGGGDRPDGRPRADLRGMSDLRLPLLPEEVTAAWLSEALSAYAPGVAVERIEVTDILWGTGTKMMATAAYNQAGRDAGLPERLCVKAGLAEHRELVKFCYQTEARF